MKPMITYENVSITLGGRPILENVNLEIAEGEVFCIIGQSGVGKSVMIKQLVGLLKPDAGRIWFEGKEVTGMSEPELIGIRRRCGVVSSNSPSC